MTASLCRALSLGPIPRASYRMCSVRPCGSRTRPLCRKARRRSVPQPLTLPPARRKGRRPRIDKPANEPWTGDTINFRAGARDPDCSPESVALRHFRRRDELGRPLYPSKCPPVRTSAELRPCMTKPCGDAFADLLPTLIDDDGRATDELRSPVRDNSGRRRKAPGGKRGSASSPYRSSHR